MQFTFSPQIADIVAKIKEAAGLLEYPVYLVGGYVRDAIMQRENHAKDIDVVCVGDGIRLAEQVAALLTPVPQVIVFRRFGTAMVKYTDIEIEFVGARKESYSPDSRKPAVENGSLTDDQNRRDFTINALAVSLNEADYGLIIDPFNGLQHITEKIIKTPLNPDSTFSDDPLRMMRAVRFSAQLGFDIDAATFEAIKRNQGRMQIISRERISAELKKIILSDTPSRGFIQLFECGLLSQFLPEMVALHGVEYRNNIGHKDNFYHTLEVLDNLSRESNNLWLRWAALLHDIAKPPTKKFDAQNGWTFHGHETLGAIMTSKIFNRLKLPLDHKLKYVQKLVALHLRPIALTNEKVTDSAVRRLLFDAGEDIEDLMILCKADITSKNEGKVQRYRDNYAVLMQKIIDVEAKDKLRNWQPPVSGEDIMERFGLPPGREIGIIKNAIREAILDGIIPNEKAAADQFMLAKASEMGIYPKDSAQS